MKRLAALIPVVIVLVLCAAGGTNAGAAPTNDFTMSADFTGLYPGARLTAPVTVHNSRSFAIDVKAATVLVADASPTCVAGNVVAHSFSGDVRVPANGTTTVPVRMEMVASAPDACQGAVFPLTFAAEGVVVGGGSNPSTAGGFAFTGPSGVQALVGIGVGAIVFGLLLVACRRFEEADA